MPSFTLGNKSVCLLRTNRIPEAVHSEIGIRPKSNLEPNCLESLGPGEGGQFKVEKLGIVDITFTHWLLTCEP